VKLTLASLLLLCLLSSGAAYGRCATYSTAERLALSDTVVLVSIVEAREGAVPWPYRFQKGALPGMLFRLRVLRSWKGDFDPDNIIYGWTAGPHVEDTFYFTHVGQQTIVFYPKGSAHELMSCFTVGAERIPEVSNELDKIVNPAPSGVSPNNSLERTRDR